MTKTAVAAVAAVLLLSASGAVSGDANPPPAAGTTATQAQVSPGAKAAAEDKIICRSQTPTGSRLGAKKVCMKKSDWDQQALQAKELMLHRPPQDPMKSN